MLTWQSRDLHLFFRYHVSGSWMSYWCLLQGRQSSEPPLRRRRRQVSLVPTPENAITSSTDSPRACCGTWWQPGEHFNYHRSLCHSQGFDPKDVGSTVSSSSGVTTRAREIANEGYPHVTSSNDSPLNLAIKKETGNLGMDGYGVSSSTD